MSRKIGHESGTSTRVVIRLRDRQAGFRRYRSCTDQNATLRIIVEQSLERSSSQYVSFADVLKAFDSLHRDTLWKLLRHYGIPAKLTRLIQKSYEGTSCQVVHGGQLTRSLDIKTRVRQGCLLSPFLFLLAINWVMKQTTEGKKNGIRWILWTQLDDLDFADDLALLSNSRQQMPEKTSILAAYASQVGLQIHPHKTKILKTNSTSTESVKLGYNNLAEVETFTYLGSAVNEQGGTDADVKTRNGKSRASFLTLKNIWRCPHHNAHQNPPIQLEHHIRPAVRSENMSNNKNHHQEGTSVHQLLSEKNPQDPLAGYHQQQESLEKSKPSASGGMD